MKNKLYKSLLVSIVLMIIAYHPWTFTALMCCIGFGLLWALIYDSMYGEHFD